MANVHTCLLCCQPCAVKHGSYKNAHNASCAALLCKTVVLVHVMK